MFCVKLSKLKVALHQLETAIDLFLEKSDYVCACTLAGAAEDILGSLAKKTGEETPDILFEIFSMQGYNRPKKDFFKHLNFIRNYLKHANLPDEDILEEDIEVWASIYIVRGIMNFVTLEKRATEKMLNFVSWLTNQSIYGKELKCFLDGSRGMIELLFDLSDDNEMILRREAAEKGFSYQLYVFRILHGQERSPL